MLTPAMGFGWCAGVIVGCIILCYHNEKQRRRHEEASEKEKAVMPAVQAAQDQGCEQVDAEGTGDTDPR